MNQKQKEQWERTRTKGMWRFVLLYGVLVWGGAMSITTWIIAMLVNGQDNVSIRVPIFLVSGIVFGLGCWFVGEYKYRKSSTNASSS